MTFSLNAPRLPDERVSAHNRSPAERIAVHDRRVEPSAQTPADRPSTAEISERLHGGACQILSATAYLAAMLKKDLEARAAEETPRAEEVCAGLREASRALRELMTSLAAASPPGDDPSPGPGA